MHAEKAVVQRKEVTMACATVKIHVVGECDYPGARVVGGKSFFELLQIFFNKEKERERIDSVVCRLVSFLFLVSEQWPSGAQGGFRLGWKVAERGM